MYVHTQIFEILKKNRFILADGLSSITAQSLDPITLGHDGTMYNGRSIDQKAKRRAEKNVLIFPSKAHPQ